MSAREGHLGARTCGLCGEGRRGTNREAADLGKEGVPGSPGTANALEDMLSLGVRVVGVHCVFVMVWTIG